MNIYSKIRGKEEGKKIESGHTHTHVQRLFSSSFLSRIKIK